MRKILLIGAALVVIAGLAVIAGCGGDAEAQNCTACGMEVAAGDAKTLDGKTFCSHCAEAAEKAVEVAGVHDCDGGCGMKAMAADQVTEIDGKYYCAGCAAKVKADDHSGHDH